MKANRLILLSLSKSNCWIQQLTLSILGCAAFVVLVGCASEPKSHTLSALPPPAPTRSVTTTTITTTPDTMPAVVDGNVATVSSSMVTTAPPAPQSEVVMLRPSANQVWVAGYWSWRNDRYEWVPGHWTLPPNPHATWVAPTWQQQGNAYKYTEGYWQN